MASSSLLTQGIANFLAVIYLLTLVLKHATKTYTRPLCANQKNIDDNNKYYN